MRDSPFDTINFLFQTRYIRSNSKVTPVFVTLFKRLSGNVKSGLESVLTDGLVECLEQDADCLKAWRINFRKYAAESNVLLRALSEFYCKEVVGW